MDHDRFEFKRGFSGARLGLVVSLMGAALTACVEEVPATITPVPQGEVGRSVEIPVNPSTGGEGGMPLEIPPLKIEQLVLFREPEGKFSLEVPGTWPPQPQDVGNDPTSDVRLGMLFPSPEGNGLVTVTQFDNGRPPQNIGNLASQVLQMSGVTEQRGYRETARSNVLEREGQAIRVALEYLRGNEPMQALVLFQADNTTFSMVNVSVVKNSWQANETAVHDILGSYSVPAVPASTIP